MSKNHNYLEAVQCGDLSAVKFYLERQSNDVDINYQDTKLRSALHRIVIGETKNWPQLVRVLIEAGIDGDLRDEQNLTAMEAALKAGRDDMTRGMLVWEFLGVPQRDAFYRLLRRGCIKLVSLYVELKKLSEAETVRYTEEALEALLMKGVQLGEQFMYDVRQMLVCYHSSNPTTCRRNDIGMSKDELLELIDFVLNNTDKHDLNELRDDVLMAMRELAKQIFVGKKRYGKVMMEIQECLWMFVGAYDGEKGIGFVSLIINKKMILSYLRLTKDILCDGEKSAISKRKRIRQQLKKTFILLKDNAALFKPIHYLMDVCKYDLSIQEDKDLKHLAIKRCIQVVGEASKSTELSPNLSKQMQNALNRMVSAKTTSHYMNMREFLSHGYPMASYLLDQEDNSNLYERLQEDLKPLLSLFKCLGLYYNIIIFRRGIGTLYNLKTLKEIRSFAMFIDTDFVATFQNENSFKETFYNEKVITNLLTDLKTLLKDYPAKSKRLNDLEQRLSNHFMNMRTHEDNSSCIGKHFIRSIQTARYNHDIDNIRAVLKSSLLTGFSNSINYFIDFCNIEGPSINETAISLLTELFDTSKDLKQGRLIADTAMELLCHFDFQTACGLKRIQSKRDVIQIIVPRIVDETLHESGAEDYYRKGVPVAVRQSLQRSLEKNVFNLEERFRILALPESPQVKCYRKKLEQELQMAFQKKIKIVQRLCLLGVEPVHSINKELRYVYVDKSCESLYQSGVEQILLEISEILLGVGVIKPNLHLLNNTIPVVCGKNLRDALAHGHNMYSVISQDRTFLLCNAIYYAHFSIELYNSESWPKANFFQFNHSKMHAKLQWFKMQEKMYEQLKDLTKADFSQPSIDQADILGLRRESKKDFKTYHNNALLQALKYNVQGFVDHIRGKKYCKKINYVINTINLPLIPRKKRSQYTAAELAQVLLNVVVAANDFTLYRTLSQELNASLTYESAFQQNELVLNHLNEMKLPLSKQMLEHSVEFGNLAVFREVIGKFNSSTIKECAIPNGTLELGQPEMTKILINVDENLYEDHIAILAATYGFNELFEQLIPKIKNWELILRCVVDANNIGAIKIIEKHSHVSDIYRNYTRCELGNLLHRVAWLNHYDIFHLLIQHKQWRLRIDEKNSLGQTVLDLFVLNGNFLAVKFISSLSTCPKAAIIVASSKNHTKIIKYLLHKNPKLFLEVFVLLMNGTIEHKNNSFLKYLLNRSQASAQQLNLSEQFRRAIYFCNVEALELLLKYDKECIHAINPENGENFYHAAVQAFDKNIKSHNTSRQASQILQIFYLLAKHQINVAVKNIRGETPLLQAVASGNRSIIVHLLKCAPETINEPDHIYHRTPLTMALLVNNLTIAKLLVDANADTNALVLFKDTALASSPPITHVVYSNLECLRYLIQELHVDPDLVDSNKCTVLLKACANKDLQTVKFLLEECRAGVTARDRHGRSIFHYAVEYSCDHILEYLLSRREYCCNVDAPDARGVTPLIVAYGYPGGIDMANKLVAAGASVEKLHKFLVETCRAALRHLSLDRQF